MKFQVTLIILMLSMTSCSHYYPHKSETKNNENLNLYGIDIQVACLHTRVDGDHDIYFSYNNHDEEKFIFHSRFNRVTPIAYDWWGGAPLWTYKSGVHEKAFALAGVRNLEIVRWQLGDQYADVTPNTPECDNVSDIDTASL